MGTVHAPGPPLPCRFTYSTKSLHGCPSDCGLCQDHLQHTCTPILEINDVCDLTCPVCIVRNQQHYSMSYEDFTHAVDALMAAEGTLPVLFLSGGEPTLHPQFFEFCDYVLDGPHKGKVTRLLISTHGRKIANSPRFAERFKERGLYASLQFDSFEADTYVKMRGADLLDTKLRCLEVLRELDIPTVLVPTLSKGDNCHEIGRLIELAASSPQISSVVFQPMAHTGDGGDGYHGSPAGHRLTMPEMHGLIEQQLGWLQAKHFHPIPCSHPSCYTATYLFRLEDGRHLPLTEFVDVGKYLDVLTNKGTLGPGADTDALLAEAIDTLWSACAVVPDRDLILDSVRNFLMQTFNAGRAQAAAEIEHKAESRMTAIFIHAFMDAWDLDVARLKKCCTHYVMPDGRLMPGCAYNNLYRQYDKRFFPNAPENPRQPVAKDES